MAPDKVKILICWLYYLPHRTGVPIYMQRVSEELVRRGHEVTILVARHQPQLKPEEVVNGVRVVRVWAPPIPISRGMVMPMYPFVANKLIKQHDVVSVHTPTPEAGFLSWVGRLHGKHVIPTHHGDLILPEGWVNRIIQGGMFMIYRYIAKHAPLIVGYTADYANHSYYLQPFRDKVKVIHPPITMPEPDMARAAELKAQWSRNGGPVIGYAGRFVQEKRPDLLIKALDTINKSHPDARIVFAGQYDIPYENTWELYQPIVRQYKDQLIFLGMIEDMQEMANFYAACDVLALTSDTECFALVQVEAMLSGTPVAMANTPGGRVPVNATGMGALMEPRNVQHMGETIAKILDDPDQYKRSRAEVENHFSFKETVDRYESIFKEYAVRG
jgi:glycosyltransferase involved in cell wall biosynthesis